MNKTVLNLSNQTETNLTKPRTVTLVCYSLYIFTGFCMVAGNTLLVFVILTTKKLRRRELLMIAGLAFGDLLYGIGNFSGGITRLALALQWRHLMPVAPWDCMRYFQTPFFIGIGNFSGGITRLALALQWRHLMPVAPWDCMRYFQTPFFIAGSQSAGLMMVMLSVDRLMAVRSFAYYITLTNRYAHAIIGCVYGYVAASVVVVTLVSYHLSNPLKQVPAICLSTHVGPKWYGFYQPTVQFSSGMLSILIFLATLYFYRKHHASLHPDVKSATLNEQCKMTRIVGATVAMTFFSYVLPHSVILIMNTFTFSAQVAGEISPYGWVVSNLNSMANIFIFGIYHRDIRAALLKLGRNKAAIVPISEGFRSGQLGSGAVGMKVLGPKVGSES